MAEHTSDTPTSNTASHIIVTRERDGAHGVLFPASSVLLTSNEADWRDVHVERLRLRLETPEHHHDEHFLTLQIGPPALVEVAQGRGRHLRVHAAPGEFALIGAGIPHRVRYEDAEVLAVSLSPALVDRVSQELTGGSTAAEFNEFIPQHSTYDPQVERFGLLLMAELEAGCPSGRLFADAVGQALVAHLLQRYSPGGEARGTEERSGLSATRLRRALDFLEENLERDIPLVDLAASAALSPYHFARQFKAATGLTPHAYLISRRVERAKDLLSHTGLPIAAVAAAVGFSHQSHLTRHFKRLVGTTPARFR